MSEETKTIKENIPAPAPKPAPTPKPAPAPAPAPTNTNIELALSNGTAIGFTNTTTGKKGVLSIQNNKLLLQRSHIYTLPLTNKTLDIDKFNVVKLNKQTSKVISVMTIDDGFVHLLPLVHGITVNDKDILGGLI